MKSALVSASPYTARLTKLCGSVMFHSDQRQGAVVYIKNGAFFALFITMREKQTLASAIESKKKIGGDNTFFRGNSATLIQKAPVKIQNKVWIFSQPKPLIISEKCVVIPNFLFRFQ